jgi:hypothetical protein
MPTALRMRLLLVLLVLYLCTGDFAFAQMETATLSGVIQDPKGASVPDAEVTATRIETGIAVTTKTNGAGIYVFVGLTPGHYHLLIHKLGFKEIAIKEFQLFVQDKLEQNFSLEIGSVSETVTVNGDDVHINTTDASVSTVVDRQFAENLPLNGRSFQTLIELTPGVVLTAANGYDAGQFSVNGQRASSNYWMVDGVSANVGVNPSTVPGDGFGGAQGTTSVFGGTNGLVSVDALQEFRIQTSTYAPEYGRTPGAQISIVTRSGTNQFHGAIFDYFRNDILDANDWFANRAGLPKPEERQNDFGGTFSGPMMRDRTFFFFSYEGLRLRLPQVGATLVPDLAARASAPLALQPYLNAFPLPSPGATDNLAAGTAEFNTSYSNPGTLDAYSLRVDQKLNDKLTLFGRYNYSPSQISQRGSALSAVLSPQVTSQTGTAGATWVKSVATTNDLRFNYTRTEASNSYSLDNIGRAVPLANVSFPSPYTAQNANLVFAIFGVGDIGLGPIGNNVQRQVNIVDNVSVQKGSHSLKFGADYRQLSSFYNPAPYGQFALFFNVPSAENGSPFGVDVSSGKAATFLFQNLGVFAQDTWRVSPRLTLTYGLRWDVDFAPSSTDGPGLPAVTGFELNDLSHLALAPPGTPPFRTPYGNVAPRLGVAYQISQSPLWATVVRGGFGVFFDLATQGVGSLLPNGYPYANSTFILGGTFPLVPPASNPPQILPPDAAQGRLEAFDPNLQLPYTLQWNFALQQALGKNQTVSATYLGATGRRLIQTAEVSPPNPNYQVATLIGNMASSNYNALQIQFQRRLTGGLQALASYTWSHSIDSASAGSIGNTSNGAASAINPNANRGSSDFDIRNALSGAVTYEIPFSRRHRMANWILGGWSTENILLARSASPVDVFNGSFNNLVNGFNVNVRPDVVPGQPLYLYGPQCSVLFGSSCPGGRGLNPAAFTNPPIDPVTGLPTRQGNLTRNALRGFSAVQWDFAVHRDFPIRESLKLQFRAEMFNLLNHPNFANPVADLSNPQFGVSTQMLGRSLGGSGQGGLSSLYQIGGPRSIQVALKLSF